MKDVTINNNINIFSPQAQNKLLILGPRLASAAPYTKATCPGYRRYTVLYKAGVESGQTGEDGRVGHWAREQERTAGVVGRARRSGTGEDWDGRHGRAGGTGGRKYLC